MALLPDTGTIADCIIIPEHKNQEIDLSIRLYQEFNKRALFKLEIDAGSLVNK